jgi:hypothetical protein
MIVLVAGIPRSGSTFTFNVVRELLQKRGAVLQKSSENIEDVYSEYDGQDHILLKAHSAANVTFNLIRSGGIKVVCTVRRPEDAIASWMQTFDYGLEESIGHMKWWIGSFERIRPYALVVPYEQIDRRPLLAISRIAKHLCDDASLAEMRQIARLYSKDRVKLMADSLAVSDEGVQDLGHTYYDNRTFFHRRHVSSLVSRSASERIGVDSVSRIRNELGRLIRPDGHLVSTANAPAPAFLDSILSLASF